jgi:hypothetical protein
VAQQNGHPPTPNSRDPHQETGNGQTPHQDQRRLLRHDSPIGPDEVYDQEADEAAYNEAMSPANGDNPDNPTLPPTGNKEHVA